MKICGKTAFFVVIFLVILLSVVPMINSSKINTSNHMDREALSDDMPPVTSLHFDPGTGIVTLYAEDYHNPGEEPGIKATYYIIDSGVVQIYHGPFPLYWGTHHVEYWSVDNAEHEEAHKSAILTVAQATLKCEGSISWNKVCPRDEVTDIFIVKNSGDPYSILDWEIAEYPDWGTWTFTPSTGEDLTPEDSPVTIEVTVTAPNEQNKDFSGQIKIVNSNNHDEYDIISISLSTPKNKQLTKSISLQIMEKLIGQLPLIGRLLNL